MADIQLISHEGELNPEDKKALIDGLLAYHASKGHPRKPKQFFSILLKNSKGKILGGISASCLWNGMEIESLWVDDSIRGQDWGTKLMENAEKEGIKRGCTISFTNTFTWQAPKFYEKLGYKLYGKLDNFPLENSLSYYYKTLR